MDAYEVARAARLAEVAVRQRGMLDYYRDVRGNLRVRGVPGDGDCFYRALFGLIGELPPGVRPVQVGKPMNPTDDEIRALRQQLARRVATIFRDFNLTGRLPPWLTTSQFRGAFDGVTEADRLRAQVRHVLRILKMGSRTAPPATRWWLRRRGCSTCR